METLKNLINPGKKEDDQILYGEGQSSHPTTSTTTEPTTSTTSGTGVTDTSTDPIGETDNAATAGTTSTTGDAFQSRGLGHLEDAPRKNDAFESSKAGTSDTTGTAYEDTPRQTEPYQSSTAPTTSTHEPVAESALTDTSARNVDAYDNDASSTTAIKGGVPGTTTDTPAIGAQDDSYTGAPSSKTQELADVAALRGEPGTSRNTATGTTATTGDSDYYPDTSAEAATTEPTTTSDSHLGRDAALGGAALGGAGLAEHEHKKNIENNDTLGSTTTGTGATTTLPDRTADTTTSGGASNKTDEILAIGAGRGERGAQAVEHPGSNNFPLTGGNSSTVTDARGLGDTTDNTANPVSYTGGLSSDSTTNPSYTNPSAFDNSTTTTDPLTSTTEPTTTTTEPTTTGDSHLGRDAALGGAALGGAGLAEHEHNKNIENNDTLGSSTTGTGAGTVGGPADWEHSHTGHGHTYEGDPCGPGAEPAGPALVDGPHATNTANLLDPNVNTTGGTSDLETTDRHHTERDAALVGGTGLAGAAAYEAEKHHDSSSAPTSSGAIGTETTDSGVTSSSTTGPVHKSSLLNKLDPRVKQDTTSQAGGAGVIGEGTTDRSGHEYDVADAGGMQGTRVAVPYEHEKTDHHYGADAAGGAALGGVAYEAEKHHEKSAAEPTNTGSSQYGGMAPLGIKHHEPEQQTSLVGTGTSSDYPGLEPTGHKFHDPEQPTSLVGTGGTSEYGGMAPKDEADEKHEEKSKSKGGILGKIFGKKDKSDSHDEKDAVEAGAAGAGTAGVVEHEEHKHEHNKLHKDPPAGYNSGETTYADAPTSGYASQVTGGTGTTALAQGEQYSQGSHLTGAGNTLDPGVADESVPASGLGTETEGGPLSSRVDDNGEQLTAGGKYHDAANMGYGEGIKAGPEAALEENRGV